MVISFIPPGLHMKVMQQCLKHGVNMTTSSYISPEMEALHEHAVKKNLIFLNEIGLDPGIDIMGTMKILHDVKEKGWKVVSYESYCGGLPVAEHATNPMGYKFSWNPGAAIKASRNPASFKRDGKKVQTSEPLKEVKFCDDISVAMKFEVYPNRDSFVFLDKFGMHDCETFIRGTFRYAGFSAVSLNSLILFRLSRLSTI
jgi:saccharopine dehydrogenase-like NADP-dependent oxidoreductase